MMRYLASSALALTLAALMEISALTNRMIRITMAETMEAAATGVSMVGMVGTE